MALAMALANQLEQAMSVVDAAVRISILHPRLCSEFKIVDGEVVFPTYTRHLGNTKPTAQQLATILGEIATFHKKITVPVGFSDESIVFTSLEPLQWKVVLRASGMTFKDFVMSHVSDLPKDCKRIEEPSEDPVLLPPLPSTNPFVWALAETKDSRAEALRALMKPAITNLEELRKSYSSLSDRDKKAFRACAEGVFVDLADFMDSGDPALIHKFMPESNVVVSCAWTVMNALATSSKRMDKPTSRLGLDYHKTAEKAWMLIVARCAADLAGQEHDDDAFSAQSVTDKLVAVSKLFSKVKT